MALALHTGMRAGELTGMRWDVVKAHSVRLPTTKNGSAREVSLSRKTARLVERTRGLDDTLVLPVGTQTLDALFRAARDAAGIDSLRWRASWIDPAHQHFPAKAIKNVFASSHFCL